MKKTKLQAHLFLLTASLIFGANYVIAKGLMPDYFSPMQIILARVSISVVLFAFLVLITGKQLPEKKDMLLFAFCGLLGVTANQTLFFVGLNLSRSVEAAIIHTTSPVWVYVIALISRKEKYGTTRSIGIMLGLLGALWLVTGGGRTGLSKDYLNGNLILLLNILAYSIYLVIVKPLTRKYHPFVVMLWVFVFGWMGALPFTWNAFEGWDRAVMDAYGWFAISYVILGTTFLAFLLVVTGLRKLSSSTAAYYIYTQPLIATVLAFFLLDASLNYIHTIAALLIFSGVFLVIRRKKGKRLPVSPAT
jgi:drug/metabolite transporter (DMT)-like permease